MFKISTKVALLVTVAGMFSFLTDLKAIIMITKEQYLEAKKIVDAYKLQLKQARVIGSKPKPKSKKKVIDLETWTRWNEIIKNI